jgi:hypothetical protein
MRVGYRIVERFSPWHDSWASYAKGSGLSHLTEVVGLDCSLCPPVQKEYFGQDDGHLVFEEYISACFRDLEYALSRTQGVFDARYHQVLALAREPTEEDVVTTNLPGCRFKGYELIEDEGSYSALTNCGGFEGAFVPTDLSECGLVSTATRAYEIRRKLVSLYPDDDHANCAVWAVWRWEANQQAASADRPSSFL